MYDSTTSTYKTTKEDLKNSTENEVAGVPEGYKAKTRGWNSRFRYWVRLAQQFCAHPERGLGPKEGLIQFVWFILRCQMPAVPD